MRNQVLSLSTPVSQNLITSSYNSPSIQDVLFFPQMKPEASQSAQSTEHRAKFLEMGIPEEWIEPLIALGYDSVEKLKEVEKPGKLANDLNGYNPPLPRLRRTGKEQA